MRTIAIIVFLLGTNDTVLGQTKGEGSLGAEAGFPTGSGTENVGTAFGGSFRYEGRIGNNASWLASFGYLSFPVTSSGLTSGISLSGSTTFLPILGGVKYYPTEVFNGFYLGGNVGVTVITVKISILGQAISGSDSENKFTFTPCIGYHFSDFDLTVSYHLIDQANYFGIRAAFAF